jgi:hypothetical protein
MAKRSYLVKGIMGLEGNVVTTDHEGVYVPSENIDCILAIDELTKLDAVVGERTVKIPFPPGAVWISTAYLQEIEHPDDWEFDGTNPWGEALWSATYSNPSDTLRVVLGKFERCLQVTVFEEDPSGEGDRVVLSEYFTKLMHTAHDEVLRCLPDLDDVVGALRGLKERERNGT